MTSTPPSTLRSGTKLVIGLFIFAIALAVGLRFYLSSMEEGSDILQQQGASAARVGIGLSQEGRKFLSPEEQGELDALYQEAMQSLRQDERQRFFELAQKGAQAGDQEIGESWALMQKSLEVLPQEKRDRLFALVSKAVQLAQQKATAGEKEP